MSQAAASSASNAHLRLVWPQWQGAGTSSVRALSPEFPFDVARRGYSVGTKVLLAVLPDHHGPTAAVPVEMGDRGLAERDGIEADLAILWIDSHPDMGTGESAYPGYHAMVVSALTGHGDAELLQTLPATTSTDRVALVGMHDWTDPTLPAIAEEWGLTVLAPDDLRTGSDALLDWLRSTGATKVAIHFDVDTIDADEVQLGLGYDRGGLSIAQTRRVFADINAVVDVVALTIAEYTPRQAMHLQQLLAGFPLL